MDGISRALKKISEVEDLKAWEPDHKGCFIFNDGAIMIELSSTRELKVTIIAGECTKIDLNLLENE